MAKQNANMFDAGGTPLQSQAHNNPAEIAEPVPSASEEARPSQ
jgi:hypothetical protein